MLLFFPAGSSCLSERCGGSECRYFAYLGGLLGSIGTGGIVSTGGTGAALGCRYGDGVRGTWILVLDLFLAV